MTTLTDFSRDAAKRYLQSIVFVDDEIYRRDSEKPVEVSTDIPQFKSPFVITDPAFDGGVPVFASDHQVPPETRLSTGDAAVPSSDQSATQFAPAAAAVELEPSPTPILPIQAVPATPPPPDEIKPPYHPRQLVESFAREGMVCALYEPKVGFVSGNTSEIFKLCERADVVILDWDLFGEDGMNILPLIANLIDQSQATIPHHVRLCAIYTSKPDLMRVANAVYEHLHARKVELEPIQLTTIVAGATRVVVWGKPDVVGRSTAGHSLEVPEEDLAGHVIDEFAEMHKGILPSYALHGMASVRRNSNRILEKFHSDMDLVFLLHRATLLADEDAFEQLPELLAEELLAVLLDDQVSSKDSTTLAEEVASTINLGQLDWPSAPHRKRQANQELAKRFLGGGAAAIAAECKSPKVPFDKFHAEFQCGSTMADRRLAALFNLRTRYVEKTPPSLGLGTIVRDNENVPNYGLCLMPACDSVRLDQTPGSKTSFPFWKLKRTKEPPCHGFAVQTGERTFEDLFVAGKPCDMLWLEEFAPSNTGTVLATGEKGSFWFCGDVHRLEWLGQLKPSHAQRIAFYIGQTFSRMGVSEAEWLRVACKS